MMDTETMTGEAFAIKYGVELTYVSRGAQADDDGWEHNAYTVTLHYDSGTLALPWKQGYGVEGVPTRGDVLENVAQDLDPADFEEWAGDYGYDTDSRKAFVTWQEVKAQSSRLYEWTRSEQMWDDLKAVREYL